MKYKQLTRKERYQISYLKSMGFKKKVIAKILGRHISTIYRELKRNEDHRGYYYPRKAHEFAIARREDNGKRAVRISDEMWGYIEYELEKQWSPEQISHFSGVSHEHIYQYVYKDKRSKIVDKRCRVGDFEVDIIIGGNRKQTLV